MDILDNPLVQSIVFYPRPDEPDGSLLPNVSDGTIAVADGVALGYRLYAHQPGAPVILYFHGNGEIASDYDYLSHHFQAAGASLLVVDYRGYGWSTGRPQISALLADVQPVLDALPDIIQRAGLDLHSLVVMGRSLGSVPAIHAAHEFPARLKGFIIESGFAHVIPLLIRLGVAAPLLANLPDPVGNARKMAEIHLPLLVIHGEDDTLIPVNNGQALYDASPASHKQLLRIPGAGHNDLLMVAPQTYFAAIADFLTTIVSSSHEGPAG